MSILTNEDLVVDLMNFSPVGPLSQVFIMEAIRRYAEQVADAPPIEHGLINGNSWKACAVDILERCDKFYNRHNTSEN